MSVFESYKKKRSKDATKKKEDKKIWAKDEDGKIVLTQELNDEIVKTFFSSQKKVASVSISSPAKQYKDEEEERLASYMLENKPFSLVDEFGEDLKNYFPELEIDEDAAQSIEFDAEGKIMKGISIKRKTSKNGRDVIDVWVNNEGHEDTARFVDEDPETIKEWLLENLRPELD